MDEIEWSKGKTHGLCSVKDWTRSGLLANHRICIIWRTNTTQANQFYFCFFFKVCNIFKEFSVKYIASIYLASVHPFCIFYGYVPVDCYRFTLYFCDVPAIWEPGAHRLLMRGPAIAWQMQTIHCENQYGCHYYPAPCFINLPVHVKVLRGTIFRYRLREQLFSQRWQTFSLHFWMLPLL